MPGTDDESRDPGQGKLADAYRKATPYLDAVWQLIGGVGVGTLVGWALDRWLDTSPWLLVALSMLGMAAGFVGFFSGLSRLK